MLLTFFSAFNFAVNLNSLKRIGLEERMPSRFEKLKAGTAALFRCRSHTETVGKGPFEKGERERVDKFRTTPGSW